VVGARHAIDMTAGLARGTSAALHRRVRGLLLVVIVAGCAHHPPGALDPRCGIVNRGPTDDAPTSLGLMKNTTVAKVTVAGTDAALAETLRRMLVTQPGTQLDNESVRNDLRKLWGLGVLSDVHVDVSSSIAGADVTFAVTPHLLIDRVYMTDDALELRRLRWLAGTPYEPVRVARLATEAQADLVYDGYLDAKVEVRRATGPGVGVCVISTRGPHVTIDKVTFPGRSVVSEAAVLAKLRGAKSGINHPGGIFDEQAADEDTLYISDLYYENGRIDMHIDTPHTVRHGDRVDLEIPIREGAVYHLGKLRVLALGGRSISLGLTPGDMFVRSRITAAIDRIAKRVGTDVNIYPVTKIDRDKHLVDIDFTVEWSHTWHALRLLPSR
jgi:outer membrane protein assembly factor BamA